MFACAAFVPSLAFSQEKAAAVSPASPTVVKQYCVGCHNQKLKTGGVALDGMDPNKVGADAAVWEKVLQKVSIGQMPPAGLPRPKPEASAAFTQWLTKELDNAALANPNPGRPTIHRLNRGEYSNAVRDLLALDIKPGARLPNDDTGYGFDNIGDVLSLSPVLIERYMSVARMVSRVAVGNPQIKPVSDEFDPPKGGGRGRRSVRVSDDLPFDSAGGLAIEYNFPVDGEYEFKIKLSGGAAPKVVEKRMAVKAGTRLVGATFLAQNSAPEIIPVALAGPAAGQGNGGGGGGAKLDLRLDGERLQLFDAPQAQFTSLTISGPFNIQGSGETASREKIFICKAETAGEETACAGKILGSLARRAYRRPVTNADVQPLMAFYQEGRKEGGFDHGIEVALRAMLVSPDFLFRVEHDAAGQAGVHRVTDVELASRLSFFLWSSIPDDELLKAAEQGKLNTPAELSAQVDRMLQDRKSKAFVANFAGQWLYLRNLAQQRPDQDLFPEYDSNLRDSFEKETELFFGAVLRENRPVTDLLSANFTYLNQRLAEHYGIPGVYGSQFRRVTLSDPNRGGLLGQGSILTVTSYPNRTSVVQRGKWVLENLLGSPPPPPPPDVSTTLEAHSKDGKILTMRQQMEQHRANPTCASCHSRMDPIGFALENYDGVGKWRANDGGAPIDATGKLPDGSTFQGPAGLKNLMANGHRDEFVETFTEKLLTFSLGRGLEYYDKPAVRAIVKEAAAQNSTIPALIHSVVNSPQFQMRRSRES